MFTNYDINTPVTPRVLSDAEKRLITDDFTAGKLVTEIKHERLIPSNLIKESIGHKKATEAKVIALMKGEVVVTPEVSHIDEESGDKVIDTAEVKNTPPITIVGLKADVNAAFPNCSITDYNVDAIVSSATSAGTFAAFKAVFE